MFAVVATHSVCNSFTAYSLALAGGGCTHLRQGELWRAHGALGALHELHPVPIRVCGTPTEHPGAEAKLSAQRDVFSESERETQATEETSIIRCL